MDLSKLSIEPRLRNAWQAIDLGFVMARRWWWPCFLVWAIPSFIVFFLLSLLLYRYSWPAILVTWWLKPLWDRLPLFVASRLLFGEPISLRASLLNLPSLAKTDLFAALTYRRLSLSRSFDLPITVLEGLRKDARSKRLAVLHSSYGNAATMLTVVCVHVEFFVTLGLLACFTLLLPEQLREAAPVVAFSESMLMEHAGNFLVWMVMALVAPFYCVAGFSLYINRRIHLEGWDIEVRFRHLLARHKGESKVGRLAACVLPLLITGVVLFSSHSWADDSRFDADYYYEQLPFEVAESKERIAEVLDGPDFFQVEMERRWRFKKREAAESDLDWVDKVIDLLRSWAERSSSLRSSLKGFASLFEIATWLLLAAVVGYVILRYRRGLARVLRMARRGSARTVEPELLFGLDVREESLPDDVCREVMQLWDAGEERQAMALLYRATLSSLIHQYGFDFYAGFTEQECVAVVAGSNHELVANYFTQLTRIWQRLAYAHQVPQREQLVELCGGWRSHFERVRHAA